MSSPYSLSDFYSASIRRSVVAPATTQLPPQLRRVLVETVNKLGQSQNTDGSWGKHSLLDQLICTTHTTMFLIAAGLDVSSDSLKRALVWLTSSSVSKHTNSYWILGPLSGWPEARDEIFPREIRKLQLAIDGQAQPSPEQFVEAFYLRCFRAAGKEPPADVQARYITRIKQVWNRDRGWVDRPDTTTACYVAAEQFDSDFAKSIQEDVIALLRRWSVVRAENEILWRNPISTAYTVMNVIESDLISNPTVRSMIEDAAQALLSLRDAQGRWASDTPYGGSGDIKSWDYPTAAVGRALIAYGSLFDPHVRGGIASALLAQEKARSKRYRALAMVAVGLLLIFETTGLRGKTISIIDQLIDEMTTSVSTEAIGLFLGLISVALGIVQFLFPELGPRLVQFSTRQLLRLWPASKT